MAARAVPIWKLPESAIAVADGAHGAARADPGLRALDQRLPRAPRGACSSGSAAACSSARSALSRCAARSSSAADRAVLRRVAAVVAAPVGRDQRLLRDAQRVVGRARAPRRTSSARGGSRCDRTRARAADAARGSCGISLAAPTAPRPAAPRAGTARPARTRDCRTRRWRLRLASRSMRSASSSLNTEREASAKFIRSAGSRSLPEAARVVHGALARLVAGVVVAGLELDRAQRVERDLALARVVGGAGPRRAALARLVELAQLHQRPGALGQPVGLVELVVARRAGRASFRAARSRRRRRPATA